MNSVLSQRSRRRAYRKLAETMTLAFGATVASHAQEVRFNQSFLRSAGTPMDVSRFEQGNSVLPGAYGVDLYLNDEWQSKYTVVFQQSAGMPSAVPCFDLPLLRRLEVNERKIGTVAADLDAGRCGDLSALVPGSRYSYDAGEQRLDITIPQALLLRGARGYVDPSLWDDGIAAGLLNYNWNFYSTKPRSGASDSFSYLGLNGGFNLGAWRFRHQGNYSWSNRAGAEYTSNQTYASRSVLPLKGQLVIGDTFTDGRLFSSIGFRGVQLSSDERMLPQSQRGYAPVVRGIANSNARVRILQSSNVIYETTVPSGPFEITDIYPNGFGGDLTVEVTEADGRVLVSRIPYAATVNSLREGGIRYQLTMGQYRDRQLSDKPAFVQGGLTYGFNNLLTGYGGFIGSRDYRAAVAGASINTLIGAFGLDVTGANADLGGGESTTGHSVRLAYSNYVDATKTNVLIAGYRYSTQGYREFGETMALRQWQDRGGRSDFQARRNRLQANVSQQLAPGYGSLYMTGSVEDYWHQSGRGTEASAGYSNSYRSMNYSVSVARRLDVFSQRWENQYMLNLSFPLGGRDSTTYASTTLQRNSNGTTSASQTVSGMLSQDRNLAYSVTANAQRYGGARDANVSGSLDYSASGTRMNVSAGTGRNYTQAGASLSGGIVAYGGGVAFSPDQGDTYAVLEAPDGAGASVGNVPGQRLDGRGKALVSNLMPYEHNSITIDPKGIPLGVEFKSTEQRVVPTAGAVVRIPFETVNRGRTFVLHVRQAGGAPLPFGAQVFDANGKTVGVVSQGSRILANGLEAGPTTLTVKWGDGDLGHCAITAEIPPPADKAQRMQVVEGLHCQPPEVSKPLGRP
ncbi:fimbria/pilus outer membrane usher protein [Achromobacter marplatensis]|nr:fimbria/pilus outer membrane usher protein [Achromobacter marplatensis]